MSQEQLHATPQATRATTTTTDHTSPPRHPVPLSSRPAVIRRTVDVAAMQKVVSPTAAAVVVKGDNRFYLRRGAGGWEISEDTYTWKSVPDRTVATLATSTATWAGKVVVVDNSQGSTMPDVVDTSAPSSFVVSPNKTFDVTEVARDLGGETELMTSLWGASDRPKESSATPGDRHSVVHHTANNDTGKTGAHLTVENAHLELMLLLKDQGTTAGLDKDVAKKPGINKALQKRELNEVDNLNFFPVETKAKAKTDEPEGVSLQDYLALITKALGALTDVPPVYAARILGAAGALAAHTKLDLGTVFLREGAGDERHLIRALLVMKDTGLVSGLALPDACAKVFEKYGTKGAQLPLQDPPGDGAEWVEKGAKSSAEETWTDLESRYVKKYFPEFAKAVRTYVA